MSVKYLTDLQLMDDLLPSPLFGHISSPISESVYISPLIITIKKNKRVRNDMFITILQYFYNKS